MQVKRRQTNGPNVRQMKQQRTGSTHDCQTRPKVNEQMNGHSASPLAQLNSEALRRALCGKPPDIQYRFVMFGHNQMLTFASVCNDHTPMSTDPLTTNWIDMNATQS